MIKWKQKALSYLSHQIQFCNQILVQFLDGIQLLSLQLQERQFLAASDRGIRLIKMSTFFIKNGAEEEKLAYWRDNRKFVYIKHEERIYFNCSHHVCITFVLDGGLWGNREHEVLSVCLLELMHCVWIERRKVCLWIIIPSSWPILLATERGKHRKLPYVYLRVCDFQKVCSHSHTTIMQSLNPESFIILLKRWSTNGAPYILGLRCFLVFSDANFCVGFEPHE